MSGLLIVIGAAVLGCAVIASVGLVRMLADTGSLRDPHGAGYQVAGLLAGTVLATTAWMVTGDGRESALALAPLAGSCWLLGLIAAERARERRAIEPLRVAGLGPRTASGFVSRHARSAMRGAFALAGGLAGLGIVLASHADPTMYDASCANGTTASHGPWPGAPYAVPALAGLALGWVLTEQAIRIVAQRPPADGRPSVDARRRILAAHTAVSAGMLIAAPTIAALLVAIGAGVHGACPTAGENALSLVLLGVGALLTVACAGAWAAALLSGGRSVVPRVPA